MGRMALFDRDALADLLAGQYGVIARSQTSKCAMPAMIFPVGRLRYAPAARAVADTVRGLSDLAAVRDVVASAVQRDRVQVWHLSDELAAGSVHGSARFRRVLREAADGVRSVAEADLRTLVKRERLRDPQPRAVAAEIRSALEASRGRQLPLVRTLPAR
jgi:hypothetical protein